MKIQVFVNLTTLIVGFFQSSNCVSNVSQDFISTPMQADALSLRITANLPMIVEFVGNVSLTLF